MSTMMTASQDGALLLTLTAASKLLGCSRYTVSDMCRRFELKWMPWRGSKVHKRISRAEIERYIKEHSIANSKQLAAEVDGRRKS